MNLDMLLNDVKAILDANGNYDNLENSNIYVPSIKVDRKNVYFILKGNDGKKLVGFIDTDRINEFVISESKEEANKTLFIGELNSKNLKAIEERFNWVEPTSRHGYKYTFGLGDRLGLASQAHLRLFKQHKDIFPVLGQQSIRELILTGRTFNDVVEDAAWAVFEEGYTTGWGADGDHVKNDFEIDYAIKSGETMITLDLTEDLHPEVVNLSDEELDEKFNALDEEFVNRFNKTYLNQEFKINDTLSVKFTKRDVEESVLMYYDAILRSVFIYNRYVVPFNLDFEVSVDETSEPTSPENHYFFANELNLNNVVVETLAPRFYGEFQKAIDYIGDVKRFEKEYIEHQAIAEKFGYRISVHSGSDKLGVYEIIGRVSEKGWHVKTAGTNWLEALRVIAAKDPELMIELYKFSYENLDDVANMYVFNAQENVKNGLVMKPEDVTLDNVHVLLQDDDTRQVLHTMYGSILNLKNSYKYVYRNRIFTILHDNEDLYGQYLNTHIAEHLDLLEGKFKTKDEVISHYEG